MMNKLTKMMVIAFASGVAASVASAVTLSVDDYRANDGSIAGFTVTSSYDAVDTNDYIFSFTSDLQDFDGVGGANDFFSFDLRLEAFTGSTVVDGGVGNGASSATLGTSALAGDDGGKNYGVFDGDTNDLDTNESMRLSIENVSLTSDLASSVTFNGFTGLGVNRASSIVVIGEGTGLESYTGATFSFSPISLLTVSALANGTRVRDLDFSFDVVAVPEASTYALIISALSLWGVVLLRRRK